jgi:hypothetical protein
MMGWATTSSCKAPQEKICSPKDQTWEACIAGVYSTSGQSRPTGSVADPDVYPGSRILIFTHPGSRISDPKTVPKERDEKKFSYQTFFCSYKFHKIEYYVIFEMLKMLKKKICVNFQRIFQYALKYMGMGSGIRDPRSGIRKKTYSGSRIQGSNRHRIPDPDSQNTADR